MLITWWRCRSGLRPVLGTEVEDRSQVNSSSAIGAILSEELGVSVVTAPNPNVTGRM